MPQNCNFGLKIENNLTDYSSCMIQINQETKTTFVMQPHLINRLIEKIWRRSDEFEELWDPWDATIQDCETR